MSTVLVSGALANKPGNGGEAWVRLSWMLGLRQLGCDVWFVEQIGILEPPARAWFEQVVARFGFGGRAAIVDPDGCVLVGPELGELEEAAARADLLLNISGNLTAQPLLGLPARRAYLDVDPGYTQVWQQTGALRDLLHRHEHLLTVALTPAALPSDALRWRPVPPPVVLAEWPAVISIPLTSDPRFTTVASWRGGYGRLEARGHLHGQKAHEFRRLAELPHAVPHAILEAALAMHPADEPDRQRLRVGGWRVVEAADVAGDPDAFRGYVHGSAAELSPAQGVYVETRCGWCSDRTTRYLATGRPAIVQDTGLPPDVPTGAGLLTFRTPAEAAAATGAILADYDAHAHAARALAEEWFDSDQVIGRVLEDVLP